MNLKRKTYYNEICRYIPYKLFNAQRLLWIHTMQLTHLTYGKIVFANLFVNICKFQMSCETKMTKALLLALGVCYQASLKSRDEYRQYITNFFLPPLDLSDGATEMEHEITKYIFSGEDRKKLYYLLDNVLCNSFFF